MQFFRFLISSQLFATYKVVKCFSSDEAAGAAVARVEGTVRLTADLMGLLIVYPAHQIDLCPCGLAICLGDGVFHEITIEGCRCTRDVCCVIECLLLSSIHLNGIIKSFNRF